MKDDEWLLVMVVILFAVVAVTALITEIEQRTRAEAAEARIEQLQTELEAARDSVLIGEIEGFNLRCYAVREEDGS